jgi:hypothetical protein
VGGGSPAPKENVVRSRSSTQAKKARREILRVMMRLCFPLPQESYRGSANSLSAIE